MADVNQNADSLKEPKSQSLASRIIAALAFATVGMKFSAFGTIADANDLLKGQNLSLWGKLKSVNTLLPKLMERARTIALAEKNPDSWWTAIKAVVKATKYTSIITAVGIVAGGTLGWVRGGKIEHAKDIFVHPIRSTKIVLGFTKPPEEIAVIEQKEPVTSAAPESEPEPDTTWRDKFAQKNITPIEPRKSFTEATLSKETFTGPAIG